MTTRPTIGANRADADIVTNTDWNRDVLQQANWAQEVLTGVNADKIPAAAISGAVGYYPNALVNGGFEVWSRGAGTFTTNGAKLADQWKMVLSGSSTASIGQAAAIATGSQYEASIQYTHVAGGSLLIFQTLENWAEFKGKQIWFVADVYANATNGVILGIADGVGSAFSAYAPNGVLTTLAATMTVSNSATTLQLQFIYQNATVTVGMIDNALVAIGSSAPAFIQEPRAELIARCERYYQQLRMTTRWRSSAAAENHSDPINFRVPMAGAPTMAVATAGTRNNLTSVALGNITPLGASWDAVATATATDTYSINDLITAEFFV